MAGLPPGRGVRALFQPGGCTVRATPKLSVTNRCIVAPTLLRGWLGKQGARNLAHAWGEWPAATPLDPFPWPLAGPGQRRSTQVNAVRDEVRATLDRIMAKLQQEAGAAAGGARGGQVGTWGHGDTAGNGEWANGTCGMWVDMELMWNRQREQLEAAGERAGR